MPVSYRSSAVSMSASLSKAIRDERYDDLRQLLTKSNVGTNSCVGGKTRQRTNDHPLWENNSRGWTPMHVAAIASATMPLEWWNWILQQQQQHSSKSKSDLWMRQTDQGQTVVGLFFRTALDPLPWCKHIIKEKACRLKDAIERILAENKKGQRNLKNTRQRHTANGNYYKVENYGMLDKLRELILVADVQDETNTDDGDVAIVFQFWKKLLALLSTPHNQHNIRQSIVSVLSDLPWCPELVGRLAIALFPMKDVVDEQAILPLHRCITSFGGSGGGTGNTPRGMLQVLCEMYPLQVSTPFANGRLPLHVALSSGPQHSWEESLIYIFRSHPSSVAEIDPITSLPAFCMAADVISPIQDYQIEQTAKNMGNRSLCWYYLSKLERRKAVEEALVFLQCQKLTAMYEVLRRDPSVLDLDSTQRTNHKR